MGARARARARARVGGKVGASYRVYTSRGARRVRGTTKEQPWGKVQPSSMGGACTPPSCSVATDMASSSSAWPAFLAYTRPALELRSGIGLAKGWLRA